MRKINKIMMITVSILLTLVLITSSVVSGTFAKYASSGQFSATARVAKWGAVVEITANRPEGVTGTDGDAIIFSTDALKMGPGSDYSDLMTVKFSGTAEVKLKVKITVDVEFVEEKMKIPANVAKSGEAADQDKCFLPMGTTFYAYAKNGETPLTNAKSYLSSPWFEKPADSQYMARALENEIVNGFKNNAGFKADENTAEKEFAPNESISFTISNQDSNQKADTFVLGFEWPSDYTNSETTYNYSEIAAYIMGEFPDVANIGITYTVTVEQVR